MGPVLDLTPGDKSPGLAAVRSTDDREASGVRLDRAVQLAFGRNEWI
jgi:hypothetical protein